MTLIAAFIGVGGLLNLILKEVGFGAILNGLIALAGALVGAATRDLFFFNDFWFEFEPYVSVGILTVAGSGAVVGSCLLRFRAQLREEEGPAPAMTGLLERRLARQRAAQ